MGHANGSIQRSGNPHVLVYCTSPQVKRNDDVG